MWTVDRVVTQEKKIATSLRALTWTVAELIPGAQVRPLGASAFIVAGVPGYRWLHRVGHERVNSVPGPTIGVRWTKGKGIIGQVWMEGREECAGSEAFDAAHSGDNEATWDALDLATRRGLSWAEYQKIKGKYGTVIAVPIVLDQEVVGVVALDTPAGYTPSIATAGVVQAVGDAATTIGYLVR